MKVLFKETVSGQLPINRGKNYIQRVLSIYTSLFRDKYGFHPQLPIGRFGKALKTLIKTHTELQIAALLIVFFEWQGMDGSDSFERDKLLKVTHNHGWFFSSVNKYEAYLRNVFGLKFDDEEEVRNFVSTNMNAIK
jgi:hypothetical protein